MVSYTRIRGRRKYHIDAQGKSMNICIVSDLFDSSYGGVPVVINRFIDRFIERGHRVTIVTSKCRNKNLTEERENLTVYRFPSFTLPKSEGEYALSFPNFHKIRQIYEREAVDVLHCHVPSLLSLACVLEARKKNVPSVATNHLLSETFSRNLFFDSARFNNFFYKLVNSFYNLVDLVLCPSIYGLRTLRKYGLSTKALVVSNGIELSKFNPNLDHEQFDTEFGLRDEDKKILYVGRLMEEKGLDVLLNAYGIVNAKIPNTNLIIVGKGHLRGNLEDLANKLSLKNVVFTGFVSDSLLKQAYSSSDLFVLPSYAEIQPLVLLEALAMGLPAIGTKVGGVPEMIVDGRNGYLLQPGDHEGLAEKIMTILNNDALREEFANNSLQIARSHDIEKSADKLERLYSRLMPLVRNRTMG
jgi:glycosyltransferase involved in cell wall biosynthesis